MKIVVDVPEGLLDQVRKAIQEGTYDDAGEFVTVALENQVELELSDATNNGILTLEEAIHGNGNQRTHRESSTGNNQKLSGNNKINTLKQRDYETVPTVPPPQGRRLDDGPLWGQYNRIFPVKLSLRALANALQNGEPSAYSHENGYSEGWVSLDEFNKQTSEIAREYGLKIKQEDENQGRGKGQKLSAALPVGDDPEKSKERFKRHFIGNVERRGNLTGAAPRLLFVNISEESPNMIGLTQEGLQFAEMWNPLIDGDISASRTLSDDESLFYINYIKNRIPDEFSALQFTAKSILQGDNRPTSLTSRVATLDDDWSSSQASTIRSGLVSRMYELGLLRRERVGQRGIAYQLTNTAKEVLEPNE